MIHLRRLLCIAAPAAAGVLWALPAAAGDPPKKPAVQCGAAAAASRNAQEREKAGQLREARQLWQACVEATCGTISPNCVVRLNALDAELPTIIPLATDRSGTPMVNVEVKMDGQPFASELDGRGVPVEPGLHEFAFVYQGRTFARLKVLIAQGQRNRPIAVSLRDDEGTDKGGRNPSAAGGQGAQGSSPDKSEGDHGAPSDRGADVTLPLEQTKSRPPSPLAWTLAGVGVAGLATGALLTYWGRVDNDSLSSCRPNCPSSVRDHIQSMYIASDIAAGIGAASAVAAIWLFATSMGPEVHHAPSAQAQPRVAIDAVDVHPAPSGGFVSLSGSF
jgi:hypothetical protein